MYVNVLLAQTIDFQIVNSLNLIYDFKKYIDI